MDDKTFAADLRAQSGSALSDLSIRRALTSGYIELETVGDYPPLDPHGPQIQPASVDLRLSDSILTYPGTGRAYLSEVDGHLFIDLKPGQCVLASTVERIRLPADVCGSVDGKSSLARRFVAIHCAGFIDPGFHGQVTLEIKNDSPRVESLAIGAPVCQVRFVKLDRPAQRPYGHEALGSHYQGQVGATPSRLTRLPRGER